MKQFLRFSFLAAVLYLNVVACEAQNFQPFRKNLTYHFIAQDTVYSMRIDSAKVVNGDSVFVFNNIARKVNSAVAVPGCSQNLGLVRYQVQNNNQFGTRIIKKQNGDYIFRTSQGQDFLLKTKTPLNQPWVFNGAKNISATLIGKTMEQVLSTSDSVFTYALSNGAQIKLSKNFGFIVAPNFVAYADAAFKPRTLQFYALPEKGIGQHISSPFAIYDFQPGDKFAYYLKRETVTPYSDICLEEWTRKEILTRRNSLNGDTIYYTIQEQKLTKGYGAAGSPWCSAPTATTLHPPIIYSMAISKDYEPITKALSNGYYGPSQFTYGGGRVILAIVRNTQFNQREQLSTKKYNYEPCSKTFSGLIDVGGSYTYVRGLGAVKIEDFSSASQETTILEAYIKGSETYGTWRTLAQILATKKELEAKPLVKTFPNPFASEIFLATGETSGSLQLTLRNTLGQAVWQKRIETTVNSEIKLDLPELAKGLYVLQAAQDGKLFTSRLVKE